MPPPGCTTAAFPLQLHALRCMLPAPQLLGAADRICGRRCMIVVERNPREGRGRRAAVAASCPRSLFSPLLCHSLSSFRDRRIKSGSEQTAGVFHRIHHLFSCAEQKWLGWVRSGQERHCHRHRHRHRQARAPHARDVCQSHQSTPVASRHTPLPSPPPLHLLSELCLPSPPPPPPP